MPSRTPPARDPWQWLFDWAEGTTTAPRIDELTIVSRGQKTDTLVKLLDLVVTKSAVLQRLALYWPLNLVEADAEQRRLAAEAIGAALFASHSVVRLKTLAIDLGELSDDDVAALFRGAARCIADKNNVLSANSVCFESVKWKPQGTSEACIVQVAKLFSAVGVRELEVNTGRRGMAPRTLKGVLQSCPQLAKLEWWDLLCDDYSELDGATWTASSGQLRALCVCVSEGNAPNELAAMDALFTRSPLSGPMAKLIMTRCPTLRHLDVTSADGDFNEALVEAFDASRCKVSSLTVQSAYGSQGNECGSLFASLKDPTRSTSRWLRTFTLGETWTDVAKHEAAVDAFLEVLASNSSLQHAVFWGTTTLEVRHKFQTLPRQFAVRLPSMRRRLALLSICGGQEHHRLPKLPPDVLRVIVEFAGRRIRCYRY